MDVLRERSALLDQLLVQEGRQPTDVKRTAAVRLFIGRDMAELDRRLSGIRTVFPGWETLSTDELVQNVRTALSGTLIGTPEEVLAQFAPMPTWAWTS